MASQPARLVVGAVPIGNVDDASPRLRSVLAHADVVAAEDTRRIRRLAAALDVQLRARLVSYFEGNDAQRTASLVDELLAGRAVLLVTDAGMPTVSDPGYRIVAAAVEAGVEVSVVPGPSAVTAALAVAGLPTDRFCFEGFLPRRASERRRRLALLATEERTLVFFEAPHRLAAMLGDLADAFGGDRRAVACRELTKTYEEVQRGSLRELTAWAAKGVRGETTLVVEGASPDAVSGDPAEWAAEVAVRQAAGMARNEAIASLARDLGVPRKAVYDADLAARKSAGPRH